MTFTGCGGLSAIGNEMQHLTPEMPELEPRNPHCNLCCRTQLPFFFC
jgi:hypothetical protein